MSLLIDPEGRELSALHKAVDFRNCDVLEVGSGNGRLTFRYAERTRSVLAIDPKADSIEAAQEIIPAGLLHKINFIQADVEQLNLPPEQFDLCVLAWSLC